MFGVVYLLTNTTNGKYYIGQTRNLKRRLRAHSRSENECSISRAIRHHGWSVFTAEVLAYGSSQEELDALEAAWITITAAHVPSVGYNLQIGNCKGAVTAEARRRMSESHKRNPNRYWLGKTRPDNSERNKRIFCGKTSWNKGVAMPPERVRALAEGRDRWLLNPESRERLRAGGIAGAKARWTKNA